MAKAHEPSSHRSPRQRWTLTREAFDRLLAALDPDADLAGEKYIIIRRNLVRFFEGRGCPFAEDHADEAINRIAKKFDEDEPIRDINGYCYGVARILLLEIFKEQEKRANALRELTAVDQLEPNSNEPDQSSERLECLTQCLEALPSDGRQLVVSYYDGDNRSRIENRKRLAESLGVANQALRSRALRLREKLESCLYTCLRKRQTPTQIQGFGH